MSQQHTDQLSRAHTWITRVLKETLTGTADRPRRLSRFDLALEHAEVRAKDKLPRDGEHGGSSSPAELGDKKDERNTANQATLDLELLKTGPRRVERLMAEIDLAVQRQTMIVRPEDEKKPPAEVPGCSSCARSVGKGAARIGGHFAPVYAKAPLTELCRWCYDFERAFGQLPPIKACDLYHRESPRAAGLFIARSPELQAAAAKVEAARQKPFYTDAEIDRLSEMAEHPRCPNVYTHLGLDTQCVRPQGHPPGCRGSYQGQSIAFPGVRL